MGKCSWYSIVGGKEEIKIVYRVCSQLCLKNKVKATKITQNVKNTSLPSLIISYFLKFSIRYFFLNCEGSGTPSRTGLRRARGLKYFPGEARSWRRRGRLQISHAKIGNLQPQFVPGWSWWIPKAPALLPVDLLQGRCSATDHPRICWNEQGQGYELLSRGGGQPCANLPAQKGRGLLKVYDFFPLKHKTYHIIGLSRA